MLKLTDWEDRSTVYIAAKHICGMFRAEAYDDKPASTLVDTAARSYQVKETPEQIMAMPEMQYEMYPAFAIAADGQVSKIGKY